MTNLSDQQGGGTSVLGFLDGYRGWALLGLIVASGIGYFTMGGGAGGVVATAPPTYIAPAFAPKDASVGPLEKVVPDTVDGKLVWPDPWDQIAEPAYRGY